MQSDSSSLFSYGVADCDVVDKDKLIAFRKKLEEWNHLFNGADAHSIAGQFGDMMWMDAAWRIANQARHFTKEDGPNASVAPLIAMLLDRGYAAGQVIAITRLLEASDTNQPKKGVISLRRLVDDFRASREAITREVFVANDALPYDWEVVKKRAYDEIAITASQTDGVTFTHMHTTGPLAFDIASRQHSLFDTLAGVDVIERRRDDLISESFFDRLESILGDPLLDEIKALRNKSIAHAADEFSRNQVVGLRTGLKLEEFSQAQYLLFSVYQTLSVVLLGQWRAAAVPVPQYNIFENLGAPFIAEARLAELRAFWDKHSKDREDWATAAYREVIPVS